VLRNRILQWQFLLRRRLLERGIHELLRGVVQRALWRGGRRGLQMRNVLEVQHNLKGIGHYVQKDLRQTTIPKS
jgi:hypothetical protein